MSVEGLHKLIMIMCSRGVDQLCHFLSMLDDVVKDSNEQETIHHFIRHFQVSYSKIQTTLIEQPQRYVTISVKNS